MPQATIIVEGAFCNGYAEHFAEYSRTVRAYLEKHHGVVLRRQRVTKQLYGEHKPGHVPDLVMLIDFPDAETAERIFFAPEYLAIIPLRDKVFADFRMYLAEFGDI